MIWKQNRLFHLRRIETLTPVVFCECKYKCECKCVCLYSDVPVSSALHNLHPWDWYSLLYGLVSSSENSVHFLQLMPFTIPHFSSTIGWVAEAVWNVKFARHFFTRPAVGIEPQTFWSWVQHPIHWAICSQMPGLNKQKLKQTHKQKALPKELFRCCFTNDLKCRVVGSALSRKHIRNSSDPTGSANYDRDLKQCNIMWYIIIVLYPVYFYSHMMHLSTLGIKVTCIKVKMEHGCALGLYGSSMVMSKLLTHTTVIYKSVHTV